MASVDREDVKGRVKEDAPIVQVRGVERGSEEDSGNYASRSSEGESHVHEVDLIRPSYDGEEDVAPSLFQKLKGSVLGAEDTLQPQDAVDAKSANSHPTPTPKGSGMLSRLKQSLWGTEEQVKNAETVSSNDVATGRKKPVGGPDENGGQFGSEELGTGYEEDTEKGGLSSDSSADLSDREGSSSQPQSLFKPVKEKNPSELTLEDLRATKANKVSSPDEIKAPGVFSRAKEEVEAVTEAAMEALNLTDKRAKSGDQLESVNQGGIFSRIAEKMGYDGQRRSQSR